MQLQEGTSMSEHLKKSPEGTLEHIEASQEYQCVYEKINSEALQAESQKEDITVLQDSVTEKAVRSEAISTADAPKKETYVHGLHGAMKQESYERSISRVQQKLSTPEKAFSKVVHNKTVENVSESIGKTAARPSGILGGGIVSLVGSFIVLYMSKKYGFEYNFIMFFIFMALGFVAGVIIELAIYSVRKIRT